MICAEDDELDLENYCDLKTRNDIKQEAVVLYVLVHQRFLMDLQGLTKMKQKVLRGICGYCPRVMCDR